MSAPYTLVGRWPNGAKSEHSAPLEDLRTLARNWSHGEDGAECIIIGAAGDVIHTYRPGEEPDDD